MIRAFFYKLLEKRHFWRQATFGEIADLYAAQMLRVAAISLASGFSSVYLYKEGYSLIFIMGFWAIYFFSKALVAPLAGVLMAKIGTTASTIISNVLYIPAIIFLSFIPQMKITGLALYGGFLCLSVALHEVCYYVNFSRVKSVANCGREIGFMRILEKVVAAVSPIIGGFIALKFNVQVTMWVSGFMLVLAGLPLLRLTNKPDKKHRIAWQSFPWKLTLPSILAEGSLGFDILASSTVWGLFVAIAILSKAGDSIYVMLGVLSSVTVVVAIITSTIFGKLIDNTKGGSLMRVGIGINVIVHLSRPFVSSTAGAIGVNAVNEVAGTAVLMPFMRGIFDIADTSGYRIIYVVLLNISKNIGSALSCLAMLLCAFLVGGKGGFQVFYVITAVVAMTVYLCKFKIYQR